MAESRSSKKTLRISAPMVVARVANDRLVHLYRGDIVPEEIDAESIKHLKSLGFVTEDEDVDQA